MTDKVNLLNFNLPQMRQFMLDIDEQPYRAVQLIKWIHHRCIADFQQMTDLSKQLRSKLQQLAVIEPPTMVLHKKSADGTQKWVLKLNRQRAKPKAYGQLSNVDDKVEMVLIPEPKRQTLCVSSQVGCSLDCSFCSTGRQGFSRNLAVSEIIGQLWLAKKSLLEQTEASNISNVVMMGMGEPLMNYKSVIQAVNMMMDDNFYGLSKRKVTISTSGIVPAMQRMVNDTDAALAVSLHAPNDELRNKLVPINKKHPIEELMSACDNYVKADTKRHVTYEYVMLHKVNDSAYHAQQLVKLLRNRAAKVNLIPFNPFANAGYKTSTPDRIEYFLSILNKNKIFASTRKTRGDDIDAACGQLVGQVKDRSSRHLRFIEPRFKEKIV